MSDFESVKPHLEALWNALTKEIRAAAGSSPQTPIPQPEIPAPTPEPEAPTTPKPETPAPTPIPETPAPVPEPVVKVVGALANVSGDEWDRGISVMTSRILMEDTPQSRTAFTPGTVIQFGNGELG